MRRATLLLPALLALAACGASTNQTAPTSASSSPPASETIAAEADAAADYNCIRAALEYSPLRTALESGADLTPAIELASSSTPEVRVPTTDAGEVVSTAILELRLALAVAVAAPDESAARLAERLQAVDDACAAIA